MSRRRDDRRDEGSVMILVLGFFVVALATVAVVVAVSTVFLAQRALSAAADGAAVAATQALDEGSVYAGDLGRVLPLDQSGAESSVAAYVDAAELGSRFQGLDWAVATDGQTATVTLAAVVPVPFVNAVTDAFGDGVTVEVTASARAPVAP